MEKIWALLFILIPLCTLHSQTNSRNYIGLHVLSFHDINETDPPAYETAQDIIKGVSLGYIYSFNDFIEIEFPVRIGKFKHILTDEDPEQNGFVGLDALLKLKYENKSWPIIPHLKAGFGAAYGFNSNTVFDIPLSGGIRIPLSKRIAMDVNATYRLGLEDGLDHFQYALGLIVPLSSPKPKMIISKDNDKDGVLNEVDECPEIPGLGAFNGCPDTDMDGIKDSEDECPDMSGPLDLNGCPDSDGDGVSDLNDRCPTVAGLVLNFGCPGKDQDSDGVPDEMDRCPTEFGLARYEGCPDTDGDGIIDLVDNCPEKVGLPLFQGCPDTDKDGVPDNSDFCPTTSGPIDNNGCPPIPEEVSNYLESASKRVGFETGSATLTPESTATLDQILNYLEEYRDYTLHISGHTDNVGNAKINQKLSEDRARSCYNYLISEGIPPYRMKYEGLGEANPITSNTTASGRALNRRVEFKLQVPQR